MSCYIEKKELKSGTHYYVFVKERGRKQSCGGFTRKKDAIARKRAVEAELAAGTFGKIKDETFSGFADRWVREYASLKKASTRSDYSGVVRKHLVPFFGKSLLSEIDPGLVQEFVSYKLSEGLSPRTVNKSLTILKLIFKHAEIQGYLRENPARHVERPRETHEEMDYLRPDEIRRLLEAASPNYRALFATAVLSGARQGELLALHRTDIDLQKGITYIRRSYNPEHGFGEPKSAKSRRAIVMSPNLVRILREHKLRTGGRGD